MEKQIEIQPCLLVILDGWGHGPNPAHSAIAQADTQFIDELYIHYPHAELTTHGEAVGLPDGQMGNSEVGHLNIGAGRIVYQDLVRINKAIQTGELATNAIIRKAIYNAKHQKKPIHLLGLVSDGGVHSHIEHLKGIIAILQQAAVPNFYIHVFTDGRDTDPKSGLQFIAEIEKALLPTSGRIATVCGRYYAMDRDKRWERTKKAYDLLVNGYGNTFTSASEAIEHAYQQGITDEFIPPSIITNSDGQPIALIEPNDIVFCFNFRTDRCRQITQVLTQQAFPELNMQPQPLQYITITRYDDNFKNVEVVFIKDNLTETLGELISNAGLKQTRMAETEKYPHVTFFFSGGREAEFPNENRRLIPSPKVATYDLQPQMSAPQLTEALLALLPQKQSDFICLNFANTDMVGHTGVFSAAVIAAQTVSACMAQIVPVALANGYELIIIADHGNADVMINEDGSPNTAHTTNPVPIFWVSSKPNISGWRLRNGILADVAPTILAIMGLKPSNQMTGHDLRVWVG